MKEYILCAAIYINDDTVYVHQPKNIDTGIVICGRRHHNCFTTLALTDITRKSNKLIQGFVTSKDRFLNRRDSAIVAYKVRQIKEPSDTLISEDLY